VGESLTLSIFQLEAYLKSPSSPSFSRLPFFIRGGGRRARSDFEARDLICRGKTGASPALPTRHNPYPDFCRLLHLWFLPLLRLSPGYARLQGTPRQHADRRIFASFRGFLGQMTLNPTLWVRGYYNGMIDSIDCCVCGLANPVCDPSRYLCLTTAAAAWSAQCCRMPGISISRIFIPSYPR
jgi:hypothetical protein